MDALGSFLDTIGEILSFIIVGLYTLFRKMQYFAADAYVLNA